MTDTPVTEDMNKRVAQYIQVRDKLRQMEDEFKQLKRPLLDIQEKLAGRIQQFMTDNNIANLRTKSGSCYISTRHTATLADPEAFMEYVIANKQFDLLERRANSTAVKAFVKKTTQLPPGCNLNAISTVGVRRAGDPGPESE